MGEVEQLLGDLGAKQWVKNRFAEKIKTFNLAGNTDVDKFIEEFNVEILEDFKIVAREAVDEVLEKAKELL